MLPLRIRIRRLGLGLSLFAAVINGVIAVPIMTVMMLMAVRQDIMGQFAITRRLTVLGWLATAIMAMVVAAMAMTWAP